MDLLTVIAVLLGLLLLFGIAAIVVFLDYARRGLTVLQHIQAAAEQDSNETLPAIRAITHDVLTTLEGGRS